MRKWFPAIPIVAVLLLTAVVYGRLPDRLVTHWTFHGLPDGYSSRVTAAWLAPGVALLLWAVLRALPRIDPFRSNYAKFQATYDIIVSAVVTLVAVEHVVVLGYGLGWSMPDMKRLMTLGVGALMLLLGNVMPRVRRNWWIGVRTPWTLTSDAVWTKTHRAGGYLAAIAGVVIMASSLLSQDVRFVVLVVCIASVAIGSVTYSYFLWREAERGSGLG